MWTKEIPKEPGFYFFKEEGYAPSIVQLEASQFSNTLKVVFMDNTQIEKWSDLNIKYWLPAIEFPDNHAK
jgi:hypothetical protein